MNSTHLERVRIAHELIAHTAQQSWDLIKRLPLDRRQDDDVRQFVADIETLEAAAETLENIKGIPHD